jgi:hypothetical protein
MKVVPSKAWSLGRGLMWITVAASALLTSPSQAPAASPPPVVVSVNAAEPGQVVPRRFVGLSFEASALPPLARDATVGNLVRFLRAIAPTFLRFGGSSVDTSTVFAPTRAARPDWADATIEPADLSRLGTLLRQTESRVVLAVTLGHYRPGVAAQEAAAASRRLGRRLAAIEIGNEPNAYPFLGLRSPDWSYERYRTQFLTYRRVIAAAAPDVPIAGPDTALFDGFGWLAAFAHDEHPAILTPHYYPLYACGDITPTLSALVSPRLAKQQRQTLRRFGDIARANRIPVWLGETNNVGCAGRAGVSDTLGAALWAVRYMLTAARAGISGVAFHTLPLVCGGYSPLCAATSSDLAAGRFQATPEWYALLLVRLLEGQRFMRTSVAGSHPGLSVDALAADSGRRIDFVLVNTARFPHAGLSVWLRLRARVRSTAVLRLTGPGLEASSGVTFGGRRVGPRGNWRPMRTLPRVGHVGHDWRVTMPPASAALVRLTVS